MGAQTVAIAKGIPCVCIDVGMDQLCRRVCAVLAPTPCNIMRAVMDWSAFPRVLGRIIFPPRGSVDVIGATLLHVISLRWRTWAVMTLGPICAGCVVIGVIWLLARGIADAAEGAGGVVPMQRRLTLEGADVAVPVPAPPKDKK